MNLLKGRDIILAGVARSGSTLACHLLNKTKHTVALHEPIQPRLVPVSSQEESIQFLQNFFLEQRHSILNQGVARSSSTDGKVPDNHVGHIDSNTGKRVILLNGSEIKIDKHLDQDFTLVVKQPGMFTAMLGTLTAYFTCYATIRNPLAVLRSWNSVDMAVTNGHAPAAEDRDPQLKKNLALEPDKYERQLILLSWYFEKYYRYLTEQQIIRYEELITSGGKNLSCISSSALLLNEKLINKNNNDLYDDSIKSDLAERLLDSNGFYWKYYSKQDVRNLLVS